METKEEIFVVVDTDILPNDIPLTKGTKEQIKDWLWHQFTQSREFGGMELMVSDKWDKKIKEINDNYYDNN